MTPRHKLYEPKRFPEHNLRTKPLRPMTAFVQEHKKLSITEIFSLATDMMIVLVHIVILVRLHHDGGLDQLQLASQSAVQALSRA